MSLPLGVLDRSKPTLPGSQSDRDMQSYAVGPDQLPSERVMLNPYDRTNLLLGQILDTLEAIRAGMARLNDEEL